MFTIHYYYRRFFRYFARLVDFFGSHVSCDGKTDMNLTRSERRIHKGEKMKRERSHMHTHTRTLNKTSKNQSLMQCNRTKMPGPFFILLCASVSNFSNSNLYAATKQPLTSTSNAERSPSIYRSGFVLSCSALFRASCPFQESSIRFVRVSWCASVGIIDLHWFLDWFSFVL